MKSFSDNVVVYVVTPPILSASTTHLNDLYSTENSRSENHLVKVIPPHALQPRHFQSLAFELYDCILKPIRPITLRGFPMQCTDHYIQYPAFTLASTEPKVPELTLAWPLRSYDVLTKWRSIHAAYGYNLETGHVVGMIVDSEGESWVSKSWEIDKSKSIMEHLRTIWDWSITRATELNVEFRLSISSMGMMTKEEIDGEFAF